jgi:MerR family transcriptional regulator, light-induced transcriptional regulator
MLVKDGEGEFYEISAVAKLTGLSIHVLRVWERRYGVVEPDRTESKRRQYSRSDVKRLTLLKALVDHGNTISSISKLNIEALEERLAEAEGSKPRDREKQLRNLNCRIGFVGIHTRKAVREAADFAEDFSIVAEFPTLSEMASNLKPGAISVLIVEIDCLFPQDVGEVRKSLAILDAKRAIVVYQFANSDLIKSENDEGLTTLRAPVTAAEILLACESEFLGERKSPLESNNDKAIEYPDVPIPSRLFTAEQLLAASRSSKILQCECPEHLANLLGGLSAFEEYSQRCENLTEADAKLHAFLHQETANCRFRMEQALQMVLNSKGFKI